MALGTHLVVFITASIEDITSDRAFMRCAEFTRYKVAINLRCVDGREMSFTCDPAKGPHCWGWRYFRDAWTRKYGRD